MRQELHETALARESLMLDQLCVAAKAFYEKTENMQAYLAWKKNKEANQNENYNHNGPDSGQP